MARLSRSTTRIQVSFFLIFFSFVFCSESTAASLESEDINELAENTRFITENFYKESFKLRMQYEYSDTFITSEHREKLQKIAKDASGKLASISTKQKALKKQIEDYEGENWDSRYGMTGLWRKLSSDIHISDLSKCQIDYYLALTLEGSAQAELLQRLEENIIKLDSSYITTDAKLLKCKIFALLSKTEPRYKELALKELEVFMVYSDVERPVSAAIEKLKLLDSAEPEQLNALINILSQNRNGRYLELVLSVAFLQRLQDQQGFEKTIELFPEIENLISNLSLDELSAHFKENKLSLEKIEQTSVLEIELAVHACWVNGPEKYKELLKHILKVDKFQTPLVTYIASAAIAKSLPRQSIELLIEASNLQKRAESKRLSVSASKIAEQAAWFAFDLFDCDTSYCQIVNRAFENYFKIVGNNFDEELEYLYTIVLNDCDQGEKSKELLQKIANRSRGEWQDKAIMELAADAFREKKCRTTEQKQILLNQFASIIAKDDGERYCDYSYDIRTLLYELTDQIEQVEVDVSDFPLLLSQVITCSEFCYNCFEGQKKYQMALLLVELLAFANSKQTQKISELQHFIDVSNQEGQAPEVDLLRYRARLLMAESQFSEAARIWAQICNIRKIERASENERSWKWWRAKFYELYCCQNIRQINKQNLLHTIEILKTTYPQIPPLWAEKLNSLKK
jgi:hypothetical protein